MSLSSWLLLGLLLLAVFVGFPIAYYFGLASGAHRLRDLLVVTAAKEKNAELARLLDADLEAAKWSNP